ncbi:Major tail tube protein FII [Escherichia coli]|uniref:phage major tail tube protein n=1 Tax=Escherichia coli TaxID=562 RepID=UPI000DFA1861|nr:phage major tail tube protein [Escherichia coli]STJ03749.1 Major tail tube protein FII [Escherichia coli]
MAVPKHLRFFTLFVDGENEVGKVTSVHSAQTDAQNRQLPGCGMMGAVSIDLGLDDSALDASFVMGAQFVSCSLSMAARLTARCCVCG